MRIDQLRGDPGLLGSFEEHLQEIRRHRAKKSGASSKNFSDINKAELGEQSMDRRSTQIKQRAEERRLTRKSVAERKSIFDQKREMEVERSANRAVARKMELEAEKYRKHLSDVAADWFCRLVVVSFGMQYVRASRQRIDSHLADLEVWKVATGLELQARRSLTRRRRKALHSNAARFRVAVAAFARTTRHTVMSNAMELIKKSLEDHGNNHRESSSLKAGVKRYIHTCALVQRRYRRLWLMRRARVEALVQRWIPLEEDIVRQNVNEARAARQAREDQAKGWRRSSTRQALDAIPDPSAVRRTGTSRRLNKCKASSWQMPACLRNRFLLKFVIQRQESLADELREWAASEDKRRQLEDVGRFFGRELTPEAEERARRPSVFNFDDLPGVVELHYEAYYAGNYRGLVHSALKIMRKGFNKWQQWRQEIADDPRKKYRRNATLGTLSSGVLATKRTSPLLTTEEVDEL